MSYAWFRLYAEVIDDPKVESLTHSQRWLWITVLCLACRSPVRGKLLLSSGERSRNDVGTETELTPVPIRILAKKAEVTAEEVESTLLLFENLGMMERGADGVWAVSHWDRRQFKSDDVTARTQKHKAKKQATEQRGNVPNNVPGNGGGTHQITDNRPLSKSHSGGARTHQPERTPQKRKEPDPNNVAASPLVKDLHDWLLDQGEEGVGDFGAATKRVADTLRGAGGKPLIPPDQAALAIEWGKTEPYWRGRLIKAGPTCLRDLWGAWKVKGQGYKPPGAREFHPIDEFTQ